MERSVTSLDARLINFSATNEHHRQPWPRSVAASAVLLLSCFCCWSSSLAAERIQWPQPRQLNTLRLANAGVRVIEGQRLTLVTDAPSSPAVVELPRVIAAALPILAKRFDVPAANLRDWRLRAYLIRDREKFDALGLLPTEAGPFPDGWAYGHEAWVIEQPSDYYRRHLLLHEMTHSFMMTQLGGCGPGWYMEGMAELLGTHTWAPRTNQLSLGVMPVSREAAPYWGRIKRVRLANTPPSIAAVMKIDNNVPLPVDSYATLWAFANFMETHPRYRDRFRTLHKQVLQADFNERFRQVFTDDARLLAVEWLVFLTSLEYGHDLSREVIENRAVRPLSPRQSQTLKLQVDRGWQPTGRAVKQGDRLRFQTDGKFVIAREAEGDELPCEANGVTLDYHGGRPLGVLLCAVGRRGFVEPITIGSGGEFTMPRDGAMFLRVNDSPAKLSDNQGTLSVVISHP